VAPDSSEAPSDWATTGDLGLGDFSIRAGTIASDSTSDPAFRDSEHRLLGDSSGNDDSATSFFPLRTSIAVSFVLMSFSGELS